VSRDRLPDLIKGMTVAVTTHGRDRYGRIIGSIEIGSNDVSHRVVADGLAWHYTLHSKDAGLAAAERDARAVRPGLWADRDPVPLWK
jgi:endonuclease YncB( thermonuclease family)